MVLTATASQQEADSLSALLVESRLAACVQVVGPVQSRYHWHGRVETGEEWLCLIKTSVGRYDEVEAFIRGAHSYDEPEIVALAVARGSAGYLAWLGTATGARSDTAP